MTTNPVNQVLVTKGGLGLLPKNSKITELVPGQIGIFNAENNLALDQTNTAAELARVNAIYFATGLGTGSVLEDVRKSSGQLIQIRNIKAATLKEYNASVPQIVEVAITKASCDTDYALKIEFKSPAIQEVNGFNGLFKTFNYRSNCCTQVDCNDCPQGDCKEVMIGLWKAVNTGGNGYVKADLIATTGGAVITDPIAWAADTANAAICPILKITTQPEAVKAFCSVPAGHIQPRGIAINVSLVGGFDCKAVVTQKQEIVYEEGAGADVAADEYATVGFNGSPLVASDLFPVTDLGGFKVIADRGVNYHQLHLDYDQFATSGWNEYLNNLRTTVAVPCADNTATLVPIVTFLNTLLGQNLSSANFDCTTPTKTKDLTIKTTVTTL